MNALSRASAFILVSATLAFLVTTLSGCPWTQKGDDQGGLKQGDGGVLVVVRTGEEAPGAPGTQFNTPTSLALNASGQVAFKATLTGAGIASENDEGIWVGQPESLALAAREGTLSPGTTGQYIAGSILPWEAILLNDEGQVAFRAKLSMADPISQGIWVGAAGSLDLVTQSGASAPGVEAGTTFGAFYDLRLAEASQVAFRAVISGPSITGDNNVGIWAGSPGNLAQIIRKGLATTPTQFSIVDSGSLPAFDGLSLNDDGRVMVRAQFPPTVTNVTDGVNVQYNYGLFMKPQLSGGSLRVRPGDRARGTRVFEYLNEPGFNASGNFAFAASYDAIHSYEDSGIWIDRQGTRYVAAVENNNPPGTPAGVVYSHLSGVKVAINNQDEMVFRAGLRGSSVTASNDVGIWAGTRDSLAFVTRTGNSAAGAPGAAFSFFAEHQINDAGDIAFRASLTGSGVVSSNNLGIWATRQGTLSLVARKGDSYQVVPGLIRTVTELKPGFAFNDSGQVAFIARFSDGTHGVVIVTP